MGGSWEKVFFPLCLLCAVIQVANGSVDFLDGLLQQEDIDVNVQDKTGRTPRVLAEQEWGTSRPKNGPVFICIRPRLDFRVFFLSPPALPRCALM